jgi:mevalonate kinase
MQPRITTTSAPGKVILCGEHAVVYGQPAIALPLREIRAIATIMDAPAGSGIVCAAPDIQQQWTLPTAVETPLAQLISLTLRQLEITPLPDLQITLRSPIPIARGMGSGAALGVALVKALATHLGHPLDPASVSALVYESERAYHGTPSGIDNTVVSYEQPVWFARSNNETLTIQPLQINTPFELVIGDTGVRAPTHITVGGVRQRRQQEPQRYDQLFAEIGVVAHSVRQQLAQGHIHAVGQLLDRNQQLLREIGVSSPELERLIEAAHMAGASGAKLSGGGGGGIMLALVDGAHAAAVGHALRIAGAVQVLHTTVG